MAEMLNRASALTTRPTGSWTSWISWLLPRSCSLVPRRKRSSGRLGLDVPFRDYGICIPRLYCSTRHYDALSWYIKPGLCSCHNYWSQRVIWIVCEMKLGMHIIWIFIMLNCTWSAIRNTSNSSSFIIFFSLNVELSFYTFLFCMVRIDFHLVQLFFACMPSLGISKSTNYQISDLQCCPLVWCSCLKANGLCDSCLLGGPVCSIWNKKNGSCKPHSFTYLAIEHWYLTPQFLSVNNLLRAWRPSVCFFLFDLWKKKGGWFVSRQSVACVMMAN